MAGGRPSPIDAVLRTREDGHDVTVAEHIVNAIRTGNYFEQACASAGIHKDTGYEWLKVGARARIRTAGRPTRRNCKAHEYRCVEFSDAIAEAEATWEVTANTTLEQLGRGGIEMTHETVEYDHAVDPPRIVKRTVRTERLAPNAQVLEWRLTRRHPERYGQRVEVTATPGVLSFEERAAALIDQFDVYLQGVADGEQERAE